MWFKRLKLGFLNIFRNPSDIHRVLMVIPLSALISHTIYLSDKASSWVVFNRGEYFLFGLVLLLFIFATLWAVFSCKFNFKLYVRQLIFILWVILFHRIAFGLESVGSMFFSILSFVALTGYVIFALTGLRLDQLIHLFVEKRNEKRNSSTVATPSK